MTSAHTLILLAIVAAWFVVFAGVHILGSRAGRGNARWLVGSYVFCLVATLLSATALALFRDAGQTVVLSLIVAALASGCLFVLYVPAFYTIITSVSVATVLLLRRNAGRLSEADLYGHFAARPILEQRFAVLIRSGYLVADGVGGVGLTLRGRKLARAFAFIKALWVLGPGG